MRETELKVVVDDLSGPEIAEFLEDHIRDMKSVSPPESKHALDLDGLRSPNITFWSVYSENELVGCGALNELSSRHGELKSMRSSPNHRGMGIGAFILSYILEESRNRGYGRVSLETGSMPFFEPARILYEKFGFTECEPFADYEKDPNSVFYVYEIGDV